MRALIFISIVFFTLNVSADNLSLEDIFEKAVYYPTKIEPKPFKSQPGNYSFLLNYKDIVKASYSDQNESLVFLSATRFYKDSIYYFFDYEISADGRFVLFSTDYKQRYRHTLFCRYYVWDVKKEILTPLNKGRRILEAKLSPENNSVAYVYDNNIFLYKFSSKNSVQLTQDGIEDEIINGMPDWLYEEEFGLTSGFEWSPNGKQLVYFKFDETRVKGYGLKKYNHTYPEDNFYKYPKAGWQNSDVSLHVYDVYGDEHKSIDKVLGNEGYIPRVYWTPWADTILLVRLNRAQNEIKYELMNWVTGQKTSVFYEKSKTYISGVEESKVLFSKENRKLFVTGNRSGFKLPYCCNVKTGEVEVILQEAKYDLIDLHHFNEKQNVLYFTSHEKSAIQSHLYSIDINSKIKTKLSDDDGWNSAYFDPNGLSYVLWHSSASLPDNYAVCNLSGNMMWTVVTNEDIIENKQVYGFYEKDFIEVETKDGVFNAFLIKPDGFVKDKKYPLLVYVYGGPGSQMVVDQWDGYREVWFQLLANKGIVIACIDNRGTGGRGVEFEHGVYKQLGKLETKDQVEFVKTMASQSFIDNDRIAIYGSSYGGYMVLKCLENAGNLFKAGISMVPITDWKYYDTGFTERYMGMPVENKKGYEKASALNNASEINSKLLLIHGMYDDNVHFQHSAELIKRLVAYDKDFEMLCLPDNNHNLNENGALLFVYRKMTKFLLENLSIVP